ncbi:MAG: hypothetical protein RIS08_6 [Actinomycetota bacterium]|jgi:glycerophosphoryl diester phosphodiesterase
MARTAYFEGPLPHLLAHRGLSEHDDSVAENSIASFQAAIAAGATHIESDVHATSDQVAVLFHDDDLLRVAGVSKLIKDLTLADLRTIRLKGEAVIPTLAEGLELGVRLNLDIKSEPAIVPTVVEIERYEAHDRVLVSSFSSKRRNAALKLLSKPVATSASMREVALALISHKMFGLGFARAVAGVDAFQIPPRMYGLNFANPRFVARLASHGIDTHFWTINDPQEATRLIQLGATGIVSDRVDLLN